jgi:hypothetical protein
MHAINSYIFCLSHQPHEEHLRNVALVFFATQGSSLRQIHRNRTGTNDERSQFEPHLRELQLSAVDLVLGDRPEFVERMRLFLEFRHFLESSYVVGSPFAFD